MIATPGQAMQRDMAPFADPATEVKLTESSKTSRIQLVRHGQAHDYLLTHEDGSVHARHANNKKFVGLHSLLASADFADIRSLLATQNRIFRDFDPEALIPPEGDLDGRKFAMQTFTRLATPSHDRNATNPTLRVVLLDGSAGVGKTSLIQRLLVQRSRASQDSTSAPPLLHIESRGRRLSSLDEALAQSLQLIRAKFTYDQLPSLIRHSLVQLAIDGFDELVDAEGYRDAWYALRDFFETTMYGGPILLAGRDTFFDEQQFSAQMKESKQLFELHHARLSEVSPASAKSWLQARGWTPVDLEDQYTDLVLRPGSYTLRPYFLQELALAKSWQAIESQDLTPRAYLVENFLQRESRLLSEKVDVPLSDIKNRLVAVFEEVAVEMADNESDVVDLSFLQMTTEMSFGDLLAESDLGKLRHKSGSFALLASDAREGFRRFPHSEIWYHFLARALVRVLARGEPTRFLRRSTLGSDLLGILAETLLSTDDLSASAFASSVDRLLTREASFDRLSENVASLAITSLVRAIEDRSPTYADIQASNVVLFGEICETVLSRVRIQRLDAAEANLSKVCFEDCEVVNLHADGTTFFGETRPKIHRLHLRSPKGAVKSLFEPSQIEEWIAARASTAIKVPTQNGAAVALLDKVCRVMLRQHMIKDHETDASGRLLRNPYWEPIETILREGGLVDRVHGKQMAGTNAPFVRMKDPFGLLTSRSGGSYANIWKKVAAIPE
jgi:hypothetical protein